jgi:hypothetical protein
VTTMQEGGISIWFFIGVSLLVNGALICGAGIYEYLNPPLQKVVLFEKHAAIWWGAVLFVSGVFYCLRFSPKRLAGK